MRSGREQVMRVCSTVCGVAIAVAACADVPTRMIAPEVNPSVTEVASAHSNLGRYVALGTSISMGWASDGVVASSQRNSWPAQLAALSGRSLDQPYISGTGCRAPMAAPLASGVRISGEPVALPPAQFLCRPLLPGIDLPTRNVAMSSATTFEAIYVTPETRNDPFYSRLYALVYPPHTTQLTAALRFPSDFASVEFGANEVLGARDGRAIPGVNLFPVQQWQFLYAALVDAVRARVPRGVLVGLIWDVASFPAYRRGHELWANRLEFHRQFNIEVKRNCIASDNLIVVPFVVPSAVAAGVAARQQGRPAVELSCAAGPDHVVDYILRPAEAAVVNAQLRQMNDFIEANARRVGYAYFELDLLYAMPQLKPPFSVVALMTSPMPYSSYVSLDGFHPSAAGQRVLATAAARAINRRYGFAIPTSGVVME